MNIIIPYITRDIAMSSKNDAPEVELDAKHFETFLRGFIGNHNVDPTSIKEVLKRVVCPYFEMVVEKLVRMYCDTNQLPQLKKLVESLELNENTSYVMAGMYQNLISACTHNNKNMVRYLCEQFDLKWIYISSIGYYDVLSALIRQENMEMIKFIYQLYKT